ncbi:SDR family NAD(P)-dependent oxidoreductase [Nocardia suismassiliense]|uniref:SDR family NAD(P)-dependent oxidoreductase n=1 Tax=Nocardia suismassiliense TaxID=2077092 RepID=UPI002D77373C|nr:SDR family NAD(P)-dependent oxidoreductase [Nocardia suismassiliense]
MSCTRGEPLPSTAADTACPPNPDRPARRKPLPGSLYERKQMTRTYLVTGSASGIGAATVDYLRDRGAHVIGVDRHRADITVDLAADEGRAELVAQTRDLAHGRLDAVIACAGVGLLDPVTLKVNYFGAVATLEGLRPLLAAGTDPRAAVVSSFAALLPSNPRLVEAALAGDESKATKVAEEAIAQRDHRTTPTPRRSTHSTAGSADTRSPSNGPAPA